MHYNKKESEEWVAACRARGITDPNILYKETVAPFIERMRKADGQLVSAIETYFWHGSFERGVSVGIITPETKFQPDLYKGTFLIGLKTPNRITIGSEEEWREHGSFVGDEFPLELLYFMNRPPEAYDQGPLYRLFQKMSKLIKTDDPRLELYIGNEEVIPNLQDVLRGD